MNIASSDLVPTLPFAGDSTGALHRAQPLVAVDPLTHGSWDALIAALPGSTVFHGSAWARVLVESYGHRPIYFGRFEKDQLKQVFPLMEVASQWTGRRGVSLPFTDFCVPPGEQEDDLSALYALAMERGQARRWRYLECRGGNWGQANAKPSLRFHSHMLDLRPGGETLLKGLESAVRRGIRKAERSGLKVQFANNLESMRVFYELHCRTRRRHGLPPQPFRFFEKIVRHVFASAQGFVAIAEHHERPVAAAVFLHNQHLAIYKFGASDYEFQQLRPNNLLMWEAIQHLVAKGIKSLHFGRTSPANEGLRRFKLSFGAREEKIEYFNYSFAKRAFVTDTDRAEGWFNRIFGALPLPLLRLAGQMLYPHLS